jgi:hypothetical protein
MPSIPLAEEGVPSHPLSEVELRFPFLVEFLESQTGVKPIFRKLTKFQVQSTVTYKSVPVTITFHPNSGGVELQFGGKLGKGYALELKFEEYQSQKVNSKKSSRPKAKPKATAKAKSSSKPKAKSKVKK